MLVLSDRLTSYDIKAWKQLEQDDLVCSRVSPSPKKIQKSIQTIRDFIEKGSAYASISWGKDSTVLAHLIAFNKIKIPLVWIRINPICNPDCILVRDAFLKKYDCDYFEEDVNLHPDIEGKYHASNSLELGFANAGKSLNATRYITGIRGAESGIRKLRQKKYGYETANTLAPITYWSTQDVFSYLAKYDVPTHPAYAMSMGGTIDRNHIRVSSVGGKRGSNMGRAEWEKLYYPDILELN